MREIKFRAWHKDESEYMNGSTCNMFQWIDDGQPVVLEQFTGLKDINCIDIYEGDLYKTEILAGHPTNRQGGKYWIKVIAKVAFKNGSFSGEVMRSIKSKCEPEYEDGHFDGRYVDIKECKEIIGNIHQRTELMEVNNE